MTNVSKNEPERISPQVARERVVRGEALLVCAYEDEQKCARHVLTDGVTLAEVPDDPADERQLIFYCG